MKKRCAIHSILLVFLFASKAIACADVRLDLDPKSLGTIAPSDQGRVSSCFAEAAVQLIDGYRISHGDKDQSFNSSPLILGAQSGDILVAGGNVADAMNSAKYNGTCDNKAVIKFLGTKDGTKFINYLVEVYAKSRGREAVNTFSNNLKESTSKGNGLAEEEAEFEHLQFRPSITFEHRSNEDGKIKKVPADKPKKYSKEQMIAATNVCYELVKMGIESRGLTNILKFIDGSRSSFVRNILENMCERKKDLRYLPTAISKDFWFQNRPPKESDRIVGLAKVISEQLEKKNQPIAIEFCNEVVTSKRHIGKYNDRGEWICEKQGGHAAVIVGSKKNLLGQCQYLVRDSFCSQYPKVAGLPGRSGISSKADVCTNGQYWIPAEKLLENTRAAIYFE